MQYSSIGPRSTTALLLFIQRTSSIISDAMASSSDRRLTPPAGPPLLEGDGTVNPAGVTYTINAQRNTRGSANVTIQGLPTTEWGIRVLKRVLAYSYSTPVTCHILPFTDVHAIEATFISSRRADKVVAVLHDNDITLTDSTDVETATITKLSITTTPTSIS